MKTNVYNTPETRGKGKKRNILKEETAQYRGKQDIKDLLTSELLNIITDTKTGTAPSTGENLLRSKEGNLSDLAKMTLQDLQKAGLTEKKAMRLMASIELGKRIAAYTEDERPSIHTPSDVARILMPEMRYYQKEVFKVILLDTKNKVIKIETVSTGILDASLVHPREVFYMAIQNMACSIILCHNHPSGNILPSVQDIEITKTLIESGKIMSIDVIDHIIIGEGKFISLKEKHII